MLGRLGQKASVVFAMLSQGFKEDTVRLRQAIMFDFLTKLT